MLYFTLFKDVFINLKLRVTETGKKTEILHVLVHAPKGCNSQDWASKKSGARSFIRVS